MSQQELIAAQVVYVNDVATILRKSEKAVRRPAQAGKLPKPIMVGRELAWPKNVLFSFLGIV